MHRKSDIHYKVVCACIHCITGGGEGVGILRKHLHTGLYSGCVNPAAERRLAGDSKKVPLSGLARLECSS